MTDRLRTRREVLAGVTLGSGAMVAVFVPTAASDSHDDLASPENDLAPARRRWLARRAARLDGEDPVSRDGLGQLLGEVLSGEDHRGDRNLVARLIDALVDSDDRSAFSEWFDNEYSELADSATAIGRRMVEFVKGHVDALVDETNWGVVRRRALEALGLMLGVALVVPVIGVAGAVLLAVTVVGIVLLPVDE